MHFMLLLPITKEPAASRCTELFAKIRHKWVNIHIPISILSTSPRGLADMDPVCGPVTGTLETSCIHEGFNQRNIMAIPALPIQIKLFQAERQQVGRQAFYLHPG